VKYDISSRLEYLPVLFISRNVLQFCLLLLLLNFQLRYFLPEDSTRQNRRNASTILLALSLAVIQNFTCAYNLLQLHNIIHGPIVYLSYSIQHTGL
jgi:hypothetical protein